MKPVSGGTAQPDIVSMWHAVKGTDYDLGIDVEKILETEEIFKECMKDYVLPPEALSVNPMIIQSPLPGGALTANTQMLRDNNLMDKFPEVVAAMKEVVMKGGFGTSVTPVSQFYFQHLITLCSDLGRKLQKAMAKWFSDTSVKLLVNLMLM